VANLINNCVILLQESGVLYTVYADDGCGSEEITFY